MNMPNTSSKPWYREPWPWFLMAGPAIVVVAGFVTAWLAVRSNDGLVEDDYYKQGLAVSQRLARDQEAAHLGLSAELVAGGNGLDLRLFLSGNADAALPEVLQLRIVHPTRAGADQTVALTKDAAGFYVGRLTAPLQGGRWHVMLEDEGHGWRIAGDWLPQEQEAARLRAATISN
ncbi:MAG: FixH family protein [Rhodocyclaceae bacterium]|nr:FixH family protein [Rhodocyclaceae bacterium]